MTQNAGFRLINMELAVKCCCVCFRFEVVYNDRCIRETDCCRVLYGTESMKLTGAIVINWDLGPIIFFVRNY